MEGIIESFGWIHFWIILGIVLGALEILTVSFFALPFALGALATAVFAYFNLPVTGQWMIFGISSLIMLFIIRYVIKNYFTLSESETIKTNADALVGKQAIVLDPIQGEVTRGSIKVGGEIWSAISDNNKAFEKGEVIEILRIDGAKVVVGPGKDANAE